MSLWFPYFVLVSFIPSLVDRHGWFCFHLNQLLDKGGQCNYDFRDSVRSDSKYVSLPAKSLVLHFLILLSFWSYQWDSAPYVISFSSFILQVHVVFNPYSFLHEFTY